MEPDVYYMNLAVAASARANCSGRTVGAVVVRNERVILTGYNGTPSKFTNCRDGGCERCKRKGDYESGTAYDLCICVHAEQNAMLTAAREGIRTEGSTVYSTLEPCFSCLKEALQAGVERVVYLDALGAYAADPMMEEQYRCLAEHLTAGFHQLEGSFGWPSSAMGAPASLTHLPDQQVTTPQEQNHPC